MRTRNVPPSSVLVDATMTFTYILQTGDPLIGTFACHGASLQAQCSGRSCHVMPIPHQSSWYISYAPWSKTESTKPYFSLAPFPTTFQCSDATALSPQAPSAPQAPLAPPRHPSAEPFQNDFPMAHSIETNSPYTKCQVTHPSRCHDLRFQVEVVGKISDFLWGATQCIAMRLGLGRYRPRGATHLPWLPMNRFRLQHPKSNKPIKHNLIPNTK